MSLKEKIEKERERYFHEALATHGYGDILNCLLRHQNNMIEILTLHLLEKEQNENKEINAPSRNTVLQANQTNEQDGI